MPRFFCVSSEGTKAKDMIIILSAYKLVGCTSSRLLVFPNLIPRKPLRCPCIRGDLPYPFLTWLR